MNKKEADTKCVSTGTCAEKVKKTKNRKKTQTEERIGKKEKPPKNFLFSEGEVGVY
jgi:hypothetical protein